MRMLLCHLTGISTKFNTIFSAKNNYATHTNKNGRQWRAYKFPARVLNQQ